MALTYTKAFWKASIKRISEEIETLNREIEVSESYIEEKKANVKELRNVIVIYKKRMKTAPDV